jgi:SnoaL-like domain
MTTDPVRVFLALWHEAVASKDPSRIEPAIADDATFWSPALFVPRRGKREVVALLGDVLASLSSYRVTKTWTDGSEILIEFEASVGDRELDGIDRIRLDDRGRLTDLRVFVRPYRALVAMMTAVADRQIARLRLPARVIARTRMKIRVARG